jgi:hypothetical protein
MNQKIGTYLGRALVTLLGLVLLIVGIALRVWKGGGHGVVMYAAVVGVFLGYGLGGDIWGARIFDLFLHTDTRKVAHKSVHPAMEKLAHFLGYILVGFLVLVLICVVAALTHQHHVGANDAVEPTRAPSGASGSP